MAEDVAQDGFDVFHLGAAFGESISRARLGVDDLKKEGGTAFFVRVAAGGSANLREGAADEGGVEFVDQTQAVALVAAKGQQRHGFVGIGGGVAVGVHGAIGRERFVFAFELLDAAHGDGGSGPVNHDGEADGRLGGEGPGMGIGAQRRGAAAEGDDLRQAAVQLV